jgi:hypothetical protein
MSRETWAKAKDLATIFSLIAIPIILHSFQDRLATRGIEKDYVQLAVEILRQPEGKENTNSEQLRTWAVKVVDEYAPVKLTAEVKSELVEKGLALVGGYKDLAKFTDLSEVRGEWASVSLPPLTKQQCQGFAPYFSNDKAWLERCLARAAEEEKKREGAQK